MVFPRTETLDVVQRLTADLEFMAAADQRPLAARLIRVLRNVLRVIGRLAKGQPAQQNRRRTQDDTFAPKPEAAVASSQLMDQRWTQHLREGAKCLVALPLRPRAGRRVPSGAAGVSRIVR